MSYFREIQITFSEVINVNIFNRFFRAKIEKTLIIYFHFHYIQSMYRLSEVTHSTLKMQWGEGANNIGRGKETYSYTAATI